MMGTTRAEFTKFTHVRRTARENGRALGLRTRVGVQARRVGPFYAGAYWVSTTGRHVVQQYRRETVNGLLRTRSRHSNTWRDEPILAGAWWVSDDGWGLPTSHQVLDLMVEFLRSR